ERVPHIHSPGEPFGDLPAVIPGKLPDLVQRYHVLAPGAELVDGPLASNAQHPGRQALPGIVTALAAPDLDEHPLQAVLRLVPGDVPAQVGQDGRPELAVTVLQRGQLALGQPGADRLYGGVVHDVPVRLAGSVRWRRGPWARPSRRPAGPGRWRSATRLRGGGA